jgi:uncharacterized protein DUF4255
MIDTSLDFLSKTLNAHLKNVLTGTSGKLVHLTHVADDSGVAIPDKGIGMSLVNIEEERVFKEQRVTFINKDGIAEKRNPEIKLNLYVLISANFTNANGDQDATDDYIEGLKRLSRVIAFFQANTVFTPDKYPLLASVDENIQKLAVELYSYSFEQLYNFWSVIGAKYLPSVLYKVRVLTIQASEVESLNLPIEKISINGKTTI